MKPTERKKIFVISYGATEKIEENINEEDYVVKSIGAFGLWQALVCVIAASTRFIAMWNMLSILFLTPTTDFTCVKFENNATLDVLNSTCYEDCLEYKYYQDVFEETLISEFGLICEHAWLASFTQTILMFGLLLGVSLFGWISDRFGRRNALLISAVTNVTFMMAAPFAPDYWTFNVMRFFIGLASGGSLIVSVVFVLEVVGSQHREVAGCCAMLPDGIAEASLAVVAYLCPTWKIYLLGYSIVSIFVLVFVLFLPETPRWLVSNRKVDKALQIMMKAAKCNKLNTSHIKENIIRSVEEMHMNKKEIISTTYLDLFSSRDLVLKTLSSIVIWTITGICYFGINQYITFLGSNVFIVVIILGLIQIPATPLSMVLNKKYGRKATTISSLIATGVTMIILIFLPKGHWACTALGIIGLSASSVTFAVIYVYCICFGIIPNTIKEYGVWLEFSGGQDRCHVSPFLGEFESSVDSVHVFCSTTFRSCRILCFIT